jgi:hypothetical protein
MSSATKWKVGGVGKAIRSGQQPSPIQDQEISGPTNHLSPRQVELDRLWRYYRCTNYAGRKYDWNGHENVGHVEHDIIAHTGQMPPGFYDAGGSMVPLKYREPSTPFYLAKVIVNRFTSLLFSTKRHPQVEADDPMTEDWLNGFAEATRLWATMIKARAYGGAMGSVGLGFKFVRGKPFIEVYDPRWCTPEFSDRNLLTVKRFEKLYQFVQQVRNLEGEWEDKWFWYRRVINDQRDVVWPKVEVKANEEPRWERERSVIYEHNFGFCPVVWIQNQQVDDDIDGDADCHGVFSLIDRIDQLWSQADRGTIANCDPSVVLSSDSSFDEIKKGSGNALHVEKGGSVQYMEMSGGGIEKAMALAEKLEEKAETVARVMLDRNEGGPSRTVEEVEHNYSSMIEQADILREQYGEKGVKTLFEMVLRAVRSMDSPRIDRTGEVPRIVKTSVRLPKKRVIDEETGETTGWQERAIGQGEQIELNWPQYFTPGGETVTKSVEAAAKAKESFLIDQEHATGYVAEYFGVENKAEMIKKIEAEQKAAQPDMGMEAAGRTAWEE